MEDNLKSISTDLFYKVRSRFSGLKLGTELGEVTINPEEAVFFDFDYMEGEKPLGHVSISLAEPSSMKVYYSTGIAENMDTFQKSGWYDFLKSLREFAKRRLMNFDTRDIAKDNLDKRDFAFLSQYSKPAIGESVMKEGMYGTSKTSYQKLNDTKLIIKHSHALPEEMKPGARSRNISALFIENQDGERFKYPFIHLAGARAMQRHVANGGVPYDEIGQHIVKMSEQVAQLKSFSNYVVRNDLLNSETNNIIERSTQALQQTRETIQRLSKQGYYEQFRETFQVEQADEVPQDVIEDLTNKFTVKNFKEDIASVFPVLYRLMKENDTIRYDDIVAMTNTEEKVEEQLPQTSESDFDHFESWVMNLGEDSALTSRDPEERQMAVEKLNGMIEHAFPAGTDGVNAIQALKGIIDDPMLAREIREASQSDANTDVRPLIYKWAEANATEALSELDFGDMGDESSGADTESQGQEQLGGVRELAEFIYSFYDRETGEFPKGQTGVVTMVQKKFGEQAAQLANQMIERMYQQKVQKEEGIQNEEQLDEFIPALIAGAARLGPLLGRLVAGGARAAAPAAGAMAKGVGQVAKSAAPTLGAVAKGGAEVAAKNAPKIATGAAIWDAYDSVKKSVFGGNEGAAGQVFKSTSDAMDAIKQYAGDKLKDIGGALPQLADMAVKYALPIGIIIAIIYGGSKLIGALTDDIEVSENKDLLRIKSLAGL